MGAGDELVCELSPTLIVQVPCEHCSSILFTWTENVSHIYTCGPFTAVDRVLQICLS